jgi:hypothetical protein
MMEGVNSSMIYLIYCKNFCKFHNVPPAQQLKEKKKRKRKTKNRIHSKKKANASLLSLNYLKMAGSEPKYSRGLRQTRSGPPSKTWVLFVIQGLTVIIHSFELHIAQHCLYSLVNQSCTLEQIGKQISSSPDEDLKFQQLFF